MQLLENLPQSYFGFSNGITFFSVLIVFQIFFSGNFPKFPSEKPPRFLFGVQRKFHLKPSRSSLSKSLGFILGIYSGVNSGALHENVL